MAAPLTSMLKTSSTKSVEPRKGIVEVGDDSKTRHNGSKIVDDEIDNGVGKKG